MRELLPETELASAAALALLCGSAAAVVVWKWLSKRHIQKKMEEARRTRDEGVKKMAKAVQQFREQVPSDKTDAILSLPLLELAGRLQEGSLSPRTVLYTYIQKALEVTQQTNCVQYFIPECEEQLQEIQQQREKGLLYGIPVSIKDHIGHKGHLSTCGLVKFLGTPEQEDSVLVKVLKRQGAIPFAKTNVPQSLFNYDCSNLIFGQTLNPLNHQKTPGGSSGGEGALIAGGGSLLGIGSDVGGSIRLPCSFCGLCGLKPTAKRLSLSGINGPVDGIVSVPCALGPMARDVDSLALCMKALLCEEMFRLDPTVPPIPFNEEVYSSSAPLRIGYYDTDGYFPLPPCMRRAVHETREALQAAGHELVLFTPLHVRHVMTELFLKTFFADGGRAWLDVFTGNIVDPGLKPQVNFCRIPRLGKKILALILKPLFPRMADYLNALCSMRSVKEMWDHQHQIEVYRSEFIAQWRELQLDVVLCPVLGPAFTIGFPGKLLSAITSTMLYNVLNFPAGVVPVSTVTEADEEELKLYRGCCGDLWDRTLKQAVEGAVGLPVAVQCVALPWQEELCLRFMKEVETLSRAKRAA
ncbi:vitamin D3 hydroxylase-associated protein-like isoform X1 [Gallus gallus]|uniref:vitamin D3 hydroxylase-associated protein-like isoform X1 n=1 Tax=Gallus gallus TaxID=9031 RepID=UPI0000E80AC1|nr:vitamin D3 hydroxylase-associated protein-like isoform X1 [Gallus gallus]|eukprot:XP_426654.4 vitamin D3 hydroxylase-associated protein-like isoform X1 [Gallus gallus]